MKPSPDFQYRHLARYYDIVRTPSDYSEETKVLRKIISEYKTSKGKELLDVGCGTGGHLGYLVKDYDCTGLDLHEGMLRVARANVPRAIFVRARMQDFKLGRKFDVIICLYSAIGLVRTYRDLERTVKNFSNHLKSGGIMMIENDSFSRPKSTSPYMNLVTVGAGNTRIAKIEYYRRKGNVLIEREDYLVAERGKGIRHYADLQYVGAFDLAKTQRILERAGLEPRFLNGVLHQGRGLLLGIRRSSTPQDPRGSVEG